MRPQLIAILGWGIAPLSFGIMTIACAAQSLTTLQPVQATGLNDVRRPQTQSPEEKMSAGTEAGPEDIARIPMVAGDLLAIQVFDAPDLSGPYTVDSGGDLTLPLIGEVHVQGLTLGQCETKIASALKSGGYILKPSVSITIQQFVPTYVTVLGEVQSPGRYLLLASHSLQQVLAMAGGPTLLASGNVEIRRKEQGNEQKFEVKLKVGAPEGAAGDTQVLPGDAITLQRAGVVYVLGGVFRPGGYVMQEDGHLNLVQAIALASGTTLQASIHSMRVLRRNEDGSLEEIDVDYKRMMAGDIPPLNLRPQDVVYVPISKAKTALSGGATSVLGAASAAAIYTVR